MICSYIIYHQHSAKYSLMIPVVLLNYVVVDARYGIKSPLLFSKINVVGKGKEIPANICNMVFFLLEKIAMNRVLRYHIPRVSVLIFHGSFEKRRQQTKSLTIATQALKYRDSEVRTIQTESSYTR